MSPIPSKVTISSIILILFLSFNTFSIEVTGWVPYYSQDVCLNNLNKTYGSVSPRDVLTSIGLQFWRPTSGGNLEIVSDCADYIESFTDWGAAHQVKVYLTLFNNNGSWDWSVANYAIQNASTFIPKIIKEMEDYNLDGIDLDLEGVGNLWDTNGEYEYFVKALYKELHAKGKDLAIDTYWGSSYGGPNPDWWNSLADSVDYIRPMMYQESNDYLSMLNLQPSGTEVTMGLPAFENYWGGQSAAQNLQDCLDLEVGVALWDLQLTASDWQTSEVWEKLAAIRKLIGTSGYTLTVNAGSGGSVNQNPSGSVFNVGETVTLTAVPDNGYKFAGWNGDASGTQTIISVTMNSAKNITASFELDGSMEAFDMLANGSWSSDVDEFNSTVTLNHSSSSASVNYNVVALPNDTDWSWVSVSAFCEGDYINLSSITVTYTASKDIFISLFQTGPSDTGASPQYLLTATTSPKTVSIAATDFVQADWVSPKTDLDLTQVTGIDFGPAEDPTGSSGVNGSFTITQLDVYGANLQAVDNKFIKTVNHNSTTIALTKNKKLNIQNIDNYTTANIFSISGKMLKSLSIQKGKNILDISDLSNQTVLISLKGKKGNIKSFKQLVR